MNITKIIRSNDFAVFTAAISMLVQSGHTYIAYLTTEAIEPTWIDKGFAVLAAIVVDLSVLFYTLRNKIKIARGAAIAMFIINVFAYWQIHQELNTRFVGGVFFSIIIPLSVYYYSETVTATRNKK